MRFQNDPRQSRLFDSFSEILSPAALKRLQSGWEFVFRQAILELMPANELGKHFSPAHGRPTKELYSMAGLILIMEFRNWTHSQAVDAYVFDVATQYALNLEPSGQMLCERTVERYLRLFRQDEMAGQVMSDVTQRLSEMLELDVSKQRLDSTHIESNMAKFGRTRLMGVAIKNFLTQLKRHDEPSYNRLRKDVRERYEPSRNQMFGDWKREEDWSKLRQTVAEDMHYLVERYAKNRKHKNRSTYLMMVKVFQQQCEVKVDKEEVEVQVRESTGGDIVVNPSDPDATLDGHKGVGFQVQLSETCSDENATQLITCAIPETAVNADSKALRSVLSHLYETELVPRELLADTSYGSDLNHQLCERDDIELVSPTSGRDKDCVLDEERLSTADFEIEMQQQPDCYGVEHTNPVCTACPAGHEPHRSHYDYVHDQINILHLGETCRDCPLRNACPQEFWDRDLSVIRIKMKDVRLERRRAAEKTDAFRERYRKRSGIEGTNSSIKRVTGMGRLRVRGRPSVFSSILLKVAGWNILRAAGVRELIHKLTKAVAVA